MGMFDLKQMIQRYIIIFKKNIYNKTRNADKFTIKIKHGLKNISKR